MINISDFYVLQRQLGSENSIKPAASKVVVPVGSVWMLVLAALCALVSKSHSHGRHNHCLVRLSYPQTGSCSDVMSGAVQTSFHTYIYINISMKINRNWYTIRDIQMLRKARKFGSFGKLLGSGSASGRVVRRAKRKSKRKLSPRLSSDKITEMERTGTPVRKREDLERRSTFQK